jgi:hypothetical protein
MANGNKGNQTRSNPVAQKAPIPYLTGPGITRMLTKQITLKVMLADTKSAPPDINFLASAFHSCSPRGSTQRGIDHPHVFARL